VVWRRNWVLLRGLARELSWDVVLLCEALGFGLRFFEETLEVWHFRGVNRERKGQQIDRGAIYKKVY
jgi:hypothetical protein